MKQTGEQAYTCDVAVVGGGCGGMAAAVAAADAGCKDVVLFETEAVLGGVLPQCIHAGFGLHTFKEELTGPEYAARFVDMVHARRIDVRLSSPVTDITRGRALTVLSERDGPYTLTAGAVVLATGCRERPAGALTITGQRPAGVMTAGTAQKYINMEGYMVGRRVVILGSGDIGLIMARRLTLEGAEVVCVCELMPWPGGLTRNIVQCLDDYDIPLRLSTTVTDVEGRDRVTGVYVAPVDEALQPIRERRELIPCDTLLLSVGLIPETGIATDAGIPLGANNGLFVDAARQTDAPGIFACGNVVQVHDLVDFVAEEGTLAGASAAAFVLSGGKPAEGNARARTAAGRGVSYVVPGLLSLDAGAATLDFRVRRHFRQSYVTVRAGDRVLIRKKKPFLLPGEMEKIDVPLDGVPDSAVLTVEIEEPAGQSNERKQMR